MQCASCGAPLAADQRYCLECGERRAALSPLTPASAAGAVAQTPSAPPPARPPLTPSATDGAAQRGNTTAVIAGVGVLLLAMGVGVLIGRSGNAKQAAASAPEVVTVAGAPAAGASSSASEASFSDDWPAGTSGYTVQLQTLPQSGTSVSAVEAAKASATSKGAKSIGALKSADFSSLTAGSYVIYSGVYHKQAEASKALAGLRKSFPAAKVISVSNHSSAAASGASGSSGGVGSSVTKPAPSSVLEGLSKVKGKSYEEKSKNLPDVVSTG